MDRQRQNEIERICDNLLMTYPKCIVGATVDVEYVVCCLGVKLTVITGEYIGIDEQISNSEDYFSIYMQKGKTQERQRFHLAKELGHLFLHVGHNKYNKKISNLAQITYGKRTARARYRSAYFDYEANQFACALLMTKGEYKHRIDAATNWENGTVDIAELAKPFCVPIKAAIIRGRMLDYFRAM